MTTKTPNFDELTEITDAEFKAFDPKIQREITMNQFDKVHLARMRDAIAEDPYKAMSQGFFGGEPIDKHDNAVYNTARELGRAITRTAIDLPASVGLMSARDENVEHLQKSMQDPKFLKKLGVSDDPEKMAKMKAYIDGHAEKFEELKREYEKRLDRNDERLTRWFGKNRDTVMGDIGGGIGSMMSLVGASAVGGLFGGVQGAAIGGMAAAGTMGVESGARIYKEGRAAGLDDDDAYNRGVGYAVIEGTLERVGVGLLWKSAGRRLVMRALRGFVVEGSEEGLQQLAEDLIMNDVRGQSALEILQDVGYSAAIGGIAGAPGGMLEGGLRLAPKARQEYIDKLTAQGIDKASAEKMVDKVAEAFADDNNVMATMQDVLNDQLDAGQYPNGNYADAQKVWASMAQDAMTEARHDIDIRDDIKARTKGLDENTQNVVADAVQNFADVISDDFGITQREFLNQTGLQISAENDSKVAGAVQFADGTRIDETGNLVDKNGNVLFQSAMYLNPRTDIQEFVQYVLNNPDGKKTYQRFNTKDGIAVDLTSDIVAHDKNRHNLTAQDWEKIINGLNNIKTAAESNRRGVFGNSVLLRIETSDGQSAAVVIDMAKGRNIISTAFFGNQESIDKWVNEKARRPQSAAANSAQAVKFYISGQRAFDDIISQLQSNVKGKRLYQQNYTADTIEVDGTERTVFNSNGDRIAGTADELRNFWRWFGDSKVVDEQGRPLVVYHGTDAEFDTFDIGKFGSTDSGTKGEGFYFTTKEKYAKFYGDNIMQLYLRVENPFFMRKNNMRETVFDLYKYLDLPTPIEIRAGSDSAAYEHIYYRAKEFTEYLKSKGFDGVIDIRQSENLTNEELKESGSDKFGEIVAFESNQIKSTDNIGTFDAGTGNIYHQDGDLDVRGYFDHTNMMQQIIGIMKSGDLDTVMHELGHFFSINYINAAIAADKTEKLQPLLEYYKVEHPAALIASTEIQEDLAVKFLSYLKTDQSPRGFRKYFDMVKDWLVKTWDSLKAKGLVQTDELPDEIVRFFDNITIRRPKNINLQNAANEKARLKKILHDARVGKLDGVSDADIHTIEELLKTATARIPRMPKSLYNKLWGQLNIKFAETHDLLQLMGIDKKAKYLATSKNGGIKDEQGLLEWLQDEGFIFGDGWSNNASQDMMRWDDALRLIGNAKNTYSIDDAVRVQEIENMRQAQEIARDVLDGQDSYNAMADIDNAKSAIQRVNAAIDRNKALNKALASDYKKLSAEVRKAKAGTSEMRKAVKTAVSFLYAQDIPTDLKAKFMRSLPMVHDSRSLAKWIAEVRDRAEKEYSDLAFRGQRDRLKHELQETYSPNKRNIKYDYEHNTLFNDLRRYNTLSAEKAQEEIQKFYDGDVEKSGLSREDELRKMMLEYRANLPRRQMSGAFMDELIGRIQEAKLIGRDAIDEIQYHRGLERMEAREEILDAIAANKSGKLDKHFAGISDFKSLLNTITNSKIADKFNMVGREINAGIAAAARQQESIAEVLRINERGVSDNPRKNSYEFLKYKAELCEPIQELNVSYTDHHGRKVIVGVDNGKKVFSRAHIMDMYNQYKDPKSRELMDKFYGEWQMDHLFSYLTDQDKQTADYLMERLRDIYDMVNPVYVSLYQKDMPRKKIYWPRQSNHEIDHELLERFDGEAREANFTKSRSHGAIPVFNRDVFSNYQAHEKDAQYMVHQAKAFKDAADIFDDSTIKEAIKNKFGKEVAGELSEHLKALSIGGVRKARAVGDTVLNQFFGQIIGSKVNLSPFVMMKQLTSFGAFSANMPLGQYYKDFAQAVIAPRKTYRYMMEHAGEYLRNRYGRGVNETMAAMIDPTRQNFMDRVFGSANRAAFNEFLSRLVRTGDVGAIVYGGYPRLKFLIEEKDANGNLVRTHDEAVNTFIKESEETQQSATNAAQSNWQRTGKTKVFAMYKTSQIQYFRRVANAYNQMKRGEITRGQFTKTTAIFTAQMAIGYKLMGDLLSAALFGWDDDKDFVDELGELAGAIITQVFDAWGAVGYFVNQAFGVMTDQKRQAELSLVGYSDVLQTINNANKIKNGKAGNAYFWVQTFAPLIEGTTGAPVSRYNRVLKKTGTYNALGI